MANLMHIMNKLQFNGRHLLRCSRGTSMIEMAIAAPVLMIFLVGVSDLTRGITERYRLQQAINRSLEMAQMGRDGDYTFLIDEVAAAANISKSNVTFEQWVQCNGVKQAWLDDCASPDIARFVRLAVRSTYTPVFGQGTFMTLQADGSVLVQAHATLRVR